MTLVQAGSGMDDLRVLSTADLDGPPNSSIQDESDRVTIVSLQDGVRGTSTTEQIRIDIKADIGFFVLEFDDQDLFGPDGIGDNSVPGAEQTVVLPYDLAGASGEQAIRTALGALRLVGGTDYILGVNEISAVGDAKRSFEVEFKADLGNLPTLRGLRHAPAGRRRRRYRRDQCQLDHAAHLPDGWRRRRRDERQCRDRLRRTGTQRGGRAGRPRPDHPAEGGGERRRGPADRRRR